jgi:hypothetical protein
MLYKERILAVTSGLYYLAVSYYDDVFGHQSGRDGKGRYSQVPIAVHSMTAADSNDNLSGLGMSKLGGYRGYTDDVRAKCSDDTNNI